MTALSQFSQNRLVFRTVRPKFLNFRPVQFQVKLSDLIPQTIKQLNNPGWSCDRFPGLCTIPAEHVNTGFIHRIISDPQSFGQNWNGEFEGNAVVLHIGEYRGGRVREHANSLVIPPGSFLFFVTREIVDLPFDIDGSLFMNPRISNLGLQFFTLGHVDPGFHGFLTATILNTTSRDIILDRHEGILYFVLSMMDHAMAPNFKSDFHSSPQDTIQKAQANLSFSTKAAFALTTESFVTRKELYAYVVLLLTLLATVFAILQYFSSNPKFPF